MHKSERILKIVLIVVSLALLSSPAFTSEENESNKGYIAKESFEECTRKSYDIDIPALHIRFPNEFIPFFNFDAYGTYSNADAGGDVWGASISSSISPAVKYNDNLYFIPLLIAN